MSQYAALFERLRNYAAGVGPEAIEVIERIEAERDKLREALKPFALVPSGVSHIEITIRWGADDTPPRTFDLGLNDFNRARDALNPAKQANP